MSSSQPASENTSEWRSSLQPWKGSDTRTEGMDDLDDCFEIGDTGGSVAVMWDRDEDGVMQGVIDIDLSEPFDAFFAGFVAGFGGGRAGRGFFERYATSTARSSSSCVGISVSVPRFSEGTCD